MDVSNRESDEQVAANKKLAAENNSLKQRLAWMEDQLSMKSKRRMGLHHDDDTDGFDYESSRGGVFTAADMQVIEKVKGWVVKNLWPHVKTLPQKWMEHCENSPKSVCCRVMETTTVPEESSSKEKHWNTTVVPAIWSKMCELRSNCDSHVRNKMKREHMHREE